MIALRPISFDNLKSHISTAFMGDRRIIDYHEKPGSTKDMVSSTYRSIMTERRSFAMSAFDVTLNGKSIGYTILNSTPFPLLYSFCIQKEYRTDEVKSGWIQSISDHFDDVWLVGLNNCNTRAINFFLRQGFTIAHEDNIHHTTLLTCP